MAPEMLSENIRDELNSLPETGYGVQRVVVTLRDGRVIPGVHVAWGSEVVRVDGVEGIPFNPRDVVAVYLDRA